MKVLLTCLGALLSGAVAAGQTAIDLRTQAKSYDFSSATYTKPFKMGGSLPAACTAGEAFLLTTAPAGQNIYACATPNAWSLQGGGAAAWNYSQSFSGKTSVTLGHGLGTRNVVALCLDSGDSMVEWNSFTVMDHDTAVVTFATPQSGRCIVNAAGGSSGGGGGLPDGVAGGDLAGSYPNPSLKTTGVIPGIYGGGSEIPVLTVDDKGRLSSVSTVPVAGGGTGNVSGPASHQPGYIPQWNTTPNSKILVEGKTAPAGALVGTTDTQTLANKTLDQPILTRAKPSAYQVGTLPPAPAVGEIVIVTDGGSADPCNTGGGSNKVWCWYNGSGWDVVGTAGGGTGTPGGNSGQVQFNIGGTFAGRDCEAGFNCTGTHFGPDTAIIPYRLAASAPLNFGTSLAGNSGCAAAQAISVPGALQSDFPIPLWPNTLPLNVIGKVWIDTNDTVNVTICNFTSATVNLAGVYTYAVAIIR